jgi:hypothetical protein
MLCVKARAAASSVSPEARCREALGFCAVAANTTVPEAMFRALAAKRPVLVVAVAAEYNLIHFPP